MQRQPAPARGARGPNGAIRLLFVLVVGMFGTLAGPAAGDPGEEIVDAMTRAATSAPGLATGPLVAPGRETEPVVLTGADVPGWSALEDVNVHVPDLGGVRCQGNQEFFGDSPVTPDEACTHNRYEDPTVSSQDLLDGEGTPIDRLLAYRWTDDGFEQIPFQVDEVFDRYLSNNVSGFSFYSNTDRHTSYAFDREGFRWTDSASHDACLAAPASEVATDPVPGLDTADELVFMAHDAGARAPGGIELPAGILDAYEVSVTDPYDPTATGFVYLARAGEDGPRAAFDADNGYVRYQRDADADVFLYSESSYSNYGNAPEGPWLDPETGECHTDQDDWRQRRPKDTATVTTPRYRFRYDGRWLLTEIAVSEHENGDWSYGRDLVDRWKARAFQQRPGGQTPCCGYEEEENNWGGSSQLLGERAGPLRVIRETWGADSGTNVVRREIFYRDEIQQTNFLRVHVIPPLDGIYAQWDHAATAVSSYYNPHVPDGVPIDGKNDEVFGNNRIHIGPDGLSIDGNDSSSDLLRDLNEGTPLTIGEPNEPDCAPAEPLGEAWDGWDDFCVYNDIDTADPLFSGPSALLAWEQIAGEHGTLVTRWSTDVDDITPGGAAHAVFALPYYRDDACFDDGTGADPGPHLNERREDTGEYATWIDEDGEERDRECWDADRHDEDPDYAADLGTERFFQGSIGTHGLHLLLIADSDNANLTAPVTEINATQRIVVLPPTLDNVGERYGRGFEKPLLAAVTPFDAQGSEGQQDTDTSLQAPGSGEYGAAIEATATLTSDGDPLDQREIAFDLGSARATATTDEDGVATATLDLVDDAGDYEVRARFEGDDVHRGSQASRQFTIEHRTTELTYLGDTRGRGEQLTVAARLTDPAEAGIADADITFTVDGREHPAVTTDEDGKASRTVDVPDHGGSVEVVVEFAGDDRNAPSSDRTTVTWGQGNQDRGRGNGPPDGTRSTAAVMAGWATGPVGTGGVLLLLALGAGVLVRLRLRPD